MSYCIVLGRVWEREWISINAGVTGLLQDWEKPIFLTIDWILVKFNTRKVVKEKAHI
jgi:hypothetical protein